MTEIRRYILLASGLSVAGAMMLLIALPLIWAPGSLILPLGRDQGIFAWVGDVILAGGLPYADAWEVKGPLAHFLYAAGLLIFGPGEFAVRALDLAVCAAGAIAAIRMGRLSKRAWAGPVAIGLMIVLAQYDFWEAAQPDGWAGFMLLWSVLLVVGPDRSMPKVAASGLLLGLAALIKPHYLLFGVIHLLCFHDAPRMEKKLRMVAVLAIAALVPAVLVVALYAAEGKLAALWNVFVLFNIEFHVSRSQFAQHAALHKFLMVVARPDAMVAYIFAGIAIFDFRRSDRSLALALMLGIALSLLIVCLQGKFWIYHFQPFDIFLATLSAIGVSTFAGTLFGKGKPLEDEDPRLITPLLVWCAARFSGAAEILRRLPHRDTATAILSLTLAEALVLVALAPVGRMVEPWAYEMGFVPEARWQEIACPPGWDYCHRNIAEAASVIRATTAPGAPVYLWGFDALLYVLADRPAASRLGYSYALLGGDAAYRQRAQAELMDDLARQPPAVIAVQTDERNDLIDRPSVSYLPEFPALEALIAASYVETFHNGSFILYMKRE